MCRDGQLPFVVQKLFQNGDNKSRLRGNSIFEKPRVRINVRCCCVSVGFIFGTVVLIKLKYVAY